MIHHFPQCGNALIITGENKRVQGSWHERVAAECILHQRESYLVRLRVWKCKFHTIEESSLFKHLKEEYPSIRAIQEKQYDGYNFNATIAEYVIIDDEVEALHFRLKYL
jgi:hypothetical protein